jgi:hypothetical protein
MGWENYHLYMFRIGTKKYGPPDPDGVDELGLVDAKRVRLAVAGSSVGTTFRYVYDWGDNWEHELLLEEILMPEPAVTYPRCLAGERRCPPEDVGGIGGYADYLEAMFDPNHKEHEDMMMWRGPFDAEEFSAEKVNQELAKKFRSKPKADALRSITSTPKLSANTKRLTKTFITPIIPQSQRIPVKEHERVPLELNRRERDLIISHTFADESITNRLRVVPQQGQRPVFHFTLDELDELVGDVAAEANHANKVLQEQLDRLCERIEAPEQVHRRGCLKRRPCTDERRVGIHRQTAVEQSQSSTTCPNCARIVSAKNESTMKSSSTPTDPKNRLSAGTTTWRTKSSLPSRLGSMHGRQSSLSALQGGNGRCLQAGAGRFLCPRHAGVDSLAQPQCGRATRPVGCHRCGRIHH